MGMEGLGEKRQKGGRKEQQGRGKARNLIVTLSQQIQMATPVENVKAKRSAKTAYSTVDSM
jgi:hypothetical protein